jgi:hypothetical protein
MTTKPRASHPVPPTNAFQSVILGVVVALAVLIAFQKAMGYDQDCATARSIQVDSDDGRLRLRMRGGRCYLKLDMRGDVRLSETEDAVSWVGPDGKFEIDHRTDAGRHRLRATPGPNPEQPVIEYEVDGEARPFDAAARAWFHGMALEVYRRAGLDREARARRIYASGGAEALADEVSEIGSDRIARGYLTAVMAQEDLAPADSALLLNAAARSVAGDYEMAQLLVDVAEVVPIADDPDLADALARAVQTIGGDYEMRRAVAAFFARGVPATVGDALLRAADGVGSDFEAAEAALAWIDMRSRVPGDGASEPLPPALFELIRGIGADYEMRRTLSAVLELGPQGEDLVAVLETARSIGGDYEMAELLVQVAASPVGREGEVARAFADAVEQIGSKHERERVLVAWNAESTAGEVPAPELSEQMPAGVTEVEAAAAEGEAAPPTVETSVPVEDPS